MSNKEILTLLLGALLLGLAPPVSSQCTGHAVLTEYERIAFLSAAYGRRANIAVQVLAAEGCAQATIEALRGTGASVRFSDQKVGYALVMLPKEKVLDVLGLPGIAYAYASTTFDPLGYLYYQNSSYEPPSERSVESVPPITIPFPRVETKVPQDGPYFAAAEAGLTIFWQQHPEADGRGVRIAVVDSGLDLLHPALQVASDGGNIVPKVADIVPFTVPDEDANWVHFGDLVQPRSGRFIAAGRTWTAPQDGTYRFGIFTKKIDLGDSEIGDDHHVKSVMLSVGVLWDEHSNKVWVDTDGDGSFRNQRALGDFAETHDVGYFGRKEGEDDNRIPFGIKIDRRRRAAYLSIADGPHGVLVAGPLAANRLTGGLFNGAAPNAQLIDVRIRPALIPSLLAAFARDDVDVITRGGSLGVWTDDGRTDFQRRVLERAVKVYDKPIVGIGDVKNMLAVYDFQSPEMLRRNRQLPPPFGETINSRVSFAPDGLVNTVLAPSTSLVTQSRYMPFALLWEDGRLHVTDVVLEPPAPAGYVIGSNMSPTIPVVSGILADLISGAKRERIPYSAVRLTSAVMIGTWRLQGFSASEQGFGVVNAVRAWDQLAEMANADDPKNPVLTSFTLARMRDGQLKEVNGFRADLPEQGRTMTAELWVTRHGGYSDGRAYTFALHGDDGTYKLLDQEATLVRDQPARVRFSAKITPGLHIAFLQLKDARAGVVMQEVPLSVRAPDVPESIARGVEKYQTRIPPLRVDRRFIRLGEETQAARFIMRLPYVGSQLVSPRQMPGFVYGVVSNRFTAKQQPSGEPVDPAHHVGPMEEFESLVSNSMPGTQEILWGNHGHPEYATPYDDPAPDVAITATLTVAKYAIVFARKDGNSLCATNKLADIEGRVELYDAKVASSELTTTDTYALASLQRTLPANLSQWRISVSSIVPSPSPVDAFLLDCTGEEGCVVVAQKLLGAAGVTLAVDNPKKGEWRIVTRARDLVQQPLSYRVREALLVLNPAATQGKNAKYASGATWMVDEPAKQSDVHYAAFRIAGTPGREDQKNGLRIAMTPMSPDAP